jgi:hypothetical protein
LARVDSRDSGDVVSDGVGHAVLVQHDFHCDAVLRLRRRRRCQREDIRRRSGLQFRGNLETLQVDIHPGNERQRADGPKILGKIPAHIRIVRHVFENLDPQIGQLLTLRRSQRRSNLHQNEIRFGRVGADEVGGGKSRCLLHRIDRYSVDRYPCHGFLRSSG